MSLMKSVSLKPGTPVEIKSKRTEEIILEYTVPDEYFAVMHITIDLFPRPSPLLKPGQPPPGKPH